MYKKKFEVNSVFYSQLNKSEKKFILKQDLSDFKVMNNYIPNFFKFLWENPKLVADIIINCDLNDIKGSLANLFMNNFYQNILSSNYVENNLMYVLTLLIKEEINNFKNIEDCDMFLGDNSKVGYFMNELMKKSDIKRSFKISISNLISDLESIFYMNFSLDIQDIISKLSKKNCQEKDSESKIATKIGYENDLNKEPLYLEEAAELSNFLYDKKMLKQIEEKEGIENLKTKYLSNLTDAYLKEKLEEWKITNPDMSAYLNKNINNSNKGNSYSNIKLMLKFAVKRDLSNKLLSHYVINFYFIKDFIDKFISILKNNLIILPYHIKCFCKIISVLLQKKFPDINISLKNSFISKFLYNKIIGPILVNPEMELLINDFIISGFTLNNLNIINEILNKLFSGKLFEDNDDIHYNNYTPFNWYFLEKMPEIFEIFKKLTDIELPPILSDLINDKLDQNFNYDYLKDNKEEVIMHYSICFNCRDLKNILDGLDHLKNKVDITKYKEGNYILKTFEKLNTDKNRNELDILEKNNNKIIIDKMKEDEKENKKRRTLKFKDKNKEKENNTKKEEHEINIENYYLFQNIVYDNKYKEISEHQSQIKNNFYIKEKKDTQNSENFTKNKIIKLKNFLSDLLYNIRPLKISDYSQCNISNTHEILNSIKHYNKLFNYILDDSIPPEWYVESIFNLLKNIPEDYTKNDFEKLYNELEEEINESMNGFNMNFLYESLNRLEFVKKEKIYYEENLKILKDLEINERVKNIVENDFIPVKIVFNYEEKNMNFNIKKSKIKKEEFPKIESKESKKSKPYIRYCNSIKSFIDKFPDFSVFQEKQDIDILEMQKNLSLPKIMKEYFFSIIQNHLTNELEIEKDKENELTQIIYKIYDYVMSKLNKKIFPKTYDEDDKLYQKIFMFSWTEPKHFIVGKNNYIFDAFLPEVIEKFHNLESEQSPRKKIIILNSIFDSITKVVQFNGGDISLGVDDQMPILNYCFIKAQPNKICSNLKFIELYRNSLIDKGNDSQMAQLVALIDFVKNITYSNLNGITKEEFVKNCNNVINSC